MPLLIHLEKIDFLNGGQLPNIIILYPKRREERVFRVKWGEFVVICYQNIIEAVNHEQRAQRSITAKTDGLM